jgi:Flp pilus assembly protein TadD
VHNAYLGQWSFFWRSFSGDEFWFLDPRTLPHSQYYRPLFDIWYAVNYHLFGLNPAGWHATMVALHLLVVFLVFEIALALTKERWAAFLAALLFGLMPIHVEAVGWVSATNVPSTAFVLGAFWFYIRRQEHPGWYWPVSLVLFVGGLLTYEGSAGFPALIAAYAFLLEENADTTNAGRTEGWAHRARRTLVCVAPFAAILLAYLAVRLWLFGVVTGSNPENHLTAAGAVLTLPAALASYLLLLAEPWRVGPAYRLQFATSISSPHFYTPLIALVAIGSALYLSLRRNRHRRLYLFCGLWIVFALAPMLNVGWLAPRIAVQDMRLYLPSVAWCIAIGELAYGYARRGTLQFASIAGCAVLIMSGYAVSLFQAQGYWHDEVALFTHCTQEVPEEPSWHEGLGMALWKRGHPEGAVREFKAELRLDPNDLDALYDLGMVYESRVLPGIDPDDIGGGLGGMPCPLSAGYKNVGQVLARAQSGLMNGSHAGAQQEAVVRQMLAHDPNNADLLAVLGSILETEGRRGESLAAYQGALRAKPDDARLHRLAASALHGLGRNREALDQVRQALRYDPNDPEAKALMAAIENSQRPH